MASEAPAFVTEFHETFGLHVLTRPSHKALDKRGKLRIDLILEEVSEFVHAVTEEDMIEVADALADLLYVTYGAALEFGIPLDDVVAEVHRSNMTKLWNTGDAVKAIADPDHPAAELITVGGGKSVVQRADGKVLKPPTFEEPNIPVVLAKATGKE